MDDHKVGNSNMKSFIENKMRLENYQKASKYTEKDVTNQKKKCSKKFKLEPILKATAITKLPEKLESQKCNNSEEYL